MSHIPKPIPGLTDIEAFRAQAHKMVDFIADYYVSLATQEVKTVRADVKPNYLVDQMELTCPDRPEPDFSKIMEEI